MIKWLLENVSAELPEYVEAQALARSKRLDGGWAELTVDPHKALGFLSRDGACTAVGFMRYKPGVTIAVVEHDFVDADYPPLVVVAEDRGDNFYNATGWRWTETMLVRGKQRLLRPRRGPDRR